MASPRRSNRIKLSAILRADGFNPSSFLQPCDGTVERPGPQTDSRERLHIEHHCVPVFVALSKACENQKCGIGHAILRGAYYRITYQTGTEESCAGSRPRIADERVIRSDDPTKSKRG